MTSNYFKIRNPEKRDQYVFFDDRIRSEVESAYVSASMLKAEGGSVSVWNSPPMYGQWTNCKIINW
jgi:hypothetical protein